MSLADIKPVIDGADDFNVIIEISAKQPGIKYEIDKDSGLLEVDRFMPTAMHYPCDYGFVPNTLSEDGDPVDVLVVCPTPIAPGSLVRCRAIGMLKMEDEKGEDNKILALPIKKACIEYAHIDTMEQVSPVLLESLHHFFENYKGLEKEKWVKIVGWFDKASAGEELESSVARFATA